jgi:NAD(P)-dependent dehydrogenase (short-subunit alcohol dehydrogenase family)
MSKKTPQPVIRRLVDVAYGTRVIFIPLESAMQIKESVALVTGANRGIGRAFVEALVERGASRIYAAAQDLGSLDAVVRRDPKRIRALKLDVTSAEDARTAAAQAKDVTPLINNAAVLAPGRLTDIPVDAVRGNMETNFFGSLNVTTAFVPSSSGTRGASSIS